MFSILSLGVDCKTKPNKYCKTSLKLGVSLSFQLCVRERGIRKNRGEREKKINPIRFVRHNLDVDVDVVVMPNDANVE